jgi:hypothetical protein
MITENYNLSKDNKNNLIGEFVSTGEKPDNIPEFIPKDLIEEIKNYSSGDIQHLNNIPQKYPDVAVVIEFLEETLNQSKNKLNKRLKEYYVLFDEKNIINYICDKGFTFNIFEAIKNKANEILLEPILNLEYIKNHEYPAESRIMIKIFANIQQSECFSKMDEIYDFLYDNYNETLISNMSIFVVKK